MPLYGGAQLRGQPLEGYCTLPGSPNCTHAQLVSRLDTLTHEASSLRANILLDHDRSAARGEAFLTAGEACPNCAGLQVELRQHHDENAALRAEVHRLQTQLQAMTQTLHGEVAYSSRLAQAVRDIQGELGRAAGSPAGHGASNAASRPGGTGGVGALRGSGPASQGNESADITAEHFTTLCSSGPPTP
eukprot:EG_transcript_23832